MRSEKTVIVEKVITQLVAETRSLIKAVHEAEDHAQRRRLELGQALLKARGLLPKRGSREDGWGAYLEAVELDEATAWRYMKLAEAVNGNLIFQEKDKVPTYAELGLDKRTGAEHPQPPPPRDEDAPRELAEEAGIVQPEVEIDRDTWCTPKWITDAIGNWDLDPCANERSHVPAKKTFMLEQRGEDGLVLARDVKKSARVFLNPPYSDVMPWIEAYGHTRFCFLLKVDPSTKWFAALLEKTQLVLIPRGTRIQFEAPEGVPPEKALANQFPHALFYARGEDVADAVRDLCFPPWRIR